MTESAYFATQGQKECYKELEVGEYEILGTLDSTTCHSCGSYDGKHFPTKDMQVGVNAPPFHPNCRCTTIPYFNDEFTQNEKRAATDENGNYIEVGNMSYKEWKNKYVVKNNVANGDESVIIKSGGISGALNPISDEAEKHAKMYYQAVRKMTTDCNHIAENTGYTVEQIKEIKDFIFMSKHDLGRGELEYFDPNYEMAQSWQRLIEGKNIQPHDLILLKHEIMEKELMSKGMTQEEAHIATSKIYNYKKESEKYYAEIEKHKKNG